MRNISTHKIKAIILINAALIIVFALYAFLNYSSFNGLSDLLIYTFVFLCCCAILNVAFVLIFIKECPIHKVFLIVGGTIGIISLLVNTPGSIPDEGSHIKNTYLWANRILGISDVISENQPSDVYKSYDSYARKRDINVINEIVVTDTSAGEYKKIIGNFTLFMSSDDAELAEYRLFDTHVYPVSYFPAIMGTAIARLLNLGTVPMLYMGKLFMLAFYIFGAYWSIKRIPFGKTTIFIIAILPMCINLAPSFSYDCVIITLSMMLVAEILYLAYGDLQRIRITDMLLAGALVFLLCPLKVMVYLPIAILFFIIPKSKFSSCWKYYIFCFTMLIVGMISVLIFNHSIFADYNPGATMTNWYLSADQTGYTAEWMLNHPLETIYIFINTTFANISIYCRLMLGGLLGWDNIPVADWIITGLAICLVLTCFKEKDTEVIAINRKQRILFLITSALVYLFFLIGMMIWWTPSGRTVVEGIQGRYFIPILPLILFSCYGLKFIEIRNGYKRIITMISIALSLCAFSNIMVKIISI
jgi:uncharacterized membrane protein